MVVVWRACAGRASIDLEDRSLPGAQRVLAFRTAGWAHTRGALPLAVEGPVGYSPYNPRRATAIPPSVAGDQV